MEASATTGQTRWGVVLLALAAGMGLWLVGPAPWPEGRGTLRLTGGSVVLLEADVEVGAQAAVSLGGASLAAHLPGGVPRSGVVEVQLSGAQLPPMGSARLSLVLPDGREELLPITAEGPDGLTAQRRPLTHARVVMGLLAAVIILWVTEAMPLHVTALLIPVALVLAGAQDSRAALAPFAHPIIALFFGGFMMAEAMKRVGLDRLVAVQAVGRLGRSPRALFAACLGVSAFLSMWMSNTAAVAVLIPIALAITEPLDDEGYRKTIILGIAYAATIGGVGSPIGTPANPLAMEFLRDYAGREISFVGWFAYGLPMVVLFLPVIGAWLWTRDRPTVNHKTFQAARQVALDELSHQTSLSGPQRIVLVVFLAVIAAWLSQPLHGVSTAIVAVGGAAALAALGQVRTTDLRAISWESLLTFGGGLAIGEALVESGASHWLASPRELLSGAPTQLSVVVIAALALGLTTVASNTASAAVLVPLAIPLASVVGADPVTLVLVVAVASSIDFALVIGTPPTMMAYSTGLFTAREVFRKGALLDLLGLILLVTVMTTWWRWAGLV